jgi:hypothetical protein
VITAIFTDVGDYPNRRREIARVAAENGADFHAITSPDRPNGLPRVAIPPAWLPAQEKQPFAEWLRGAYRPIFHILEQRIASDYFLLIEGDVHGDSAAWQRLFSADLSTAPDLAAPFARIGGQGWQCHGALMLISRRAADWISEAAETNCHQLFELSIPQSVAAAGGTIRDLRSVAGARIFSRRTLRFCQPDKPQPVPLIKPGMLSHPCKWDPPP